jgi:hypothetical protein
MSRGYTWGTQPNSTLDDQRNSLCNKKRANHTSLPGPWLAMATCVRKQNLPPSASKWTKRDVNSAAQYYIYPGITRQSESAVFPGMEICLFPFFCLWCQHHAMWRFLPSFLFWFA